MTRASHLTAAAAAAIALFGVACSEANSPADSSQFALAASFASIPSGFDNTTNSFAGGDDAAGPWIPRHSPDRGLGLDGGLMGGGIGIEFLGGLNFGRGRGPGPFHPFNGRGPSCDGTYSAAAGRVTCETLTRGGLTIARSIAYTTTAGVAQPAFDDATTNTINTKTAVTGTRTHSRHGDSVTATVNHASDRTVSGLADGSTQRTINGTAAGREDITGSDSSGTFTAVRTVGDTTRNLVIPVQDEKPTFPTAGAVIREMTIVVTRAGQSPVTSSRREVITYDGSATATVVITKDGTTKTCMLPLPHGRPTCS